MTDERLPGGIVLYPACFLQCASMFFSGFLKEKTDSFTIGSSALKDYKKGTIFVNGEAVLHQYLTQLPVIDYHTPTSPCFSNP